MCEKCTELDSKAAHYRFLATRITDPLTLKGIAELIEEIREAKAGFHPC
jgi:hypothetical protein